jgi:hypothetical protein
MENPLHILLLLVLGALLLFVLDVYGGGAFFGRLKAREFRTRAAPFFLLIPGLGLAPRHPEAARGGNIGLIRDGDIIEIDAEAGTLNVKLTDAELAHRKTKWAARATNHTSGALWKYAQQVGPAVDGAVTHPGGAHEKQCYADI